MDAFIVTALVDTTALILPNSGPLMACFHFLASGVAQAEIWLTLAAFKSYDTAPKYSLLLCWVHITKKVILVIMCLGSTYLGYWLTTAFGSRLGPQSTLANFKADTQATYAEALKTAPLYIKPLFLNCFFLGVPIMVTFAQVGLLSWHMSSFCREQDIWNDLVNSLKEAAKLWNNLNKSTNAATSILSDGLFKNVNGDPIAMALVAQTRAVTLMTAEVETNDRQLIQRSQVMAFAWGVFLLITLIIYASATWSLISLIKSADTEPVRRKRKMQVGLLSRRKNSYTEEGGAISVDNEEARLLHRGLRYLTLHSLTMITAILYSSVVCFIMGAHAEAIMVTAHWRGLGSWLSLASGIFIAMAMAFQFSSFWGTILMWRVWVDLDIIIPVQDARNEHEYDTFQGDIPLQEKAGDLAYQSQ
ncbi:uncharacterized protein MELLADRAFT_85110 [Melampsora larici-populina 98AG31]|uniref:Uncharacterized protein n=1 Tax=Melampsora larici-populina (strain 98AG31 / pathotype 3-4-7) TaxID=747676 RepID=F4SCW4_MELLP|nr:uncharacterized protein MELLADRAFT_85110 [Melampsora larici-populina 98AG31]EGF97509.1 hypothetical protein MELLADRAFT_85110 [Melampsora larici-populina 98AG31]